MRKYIGPLALALALTAGAPPPSAGNAVIVARAVGPEEWRLESKPGTTLRNIRLVEGQKIILIDARGTREIEGPGELLMLSKGVDKGAPIFTMVFRAIAPVPGPTLKAGVRGAGEIPQKGGWTQLVPRPAVDPR